MTDTDIYDRLANVAVEATSPDNNIKARVRSGGHDFRIGFRPGAYQRYEENGLANQLAHLALRVWDAYRDACRRAQGPPSEDAEEASPRHRAYARAIGEITATGQSPRDAVGFRAVGLNTWEAEVAPGTIEGLDEPTFCGEVIGAWNDLLASHECRVILLKERHLGLAIPPWWKDYLPKDI